ncbi:MAG TPA: PqqD family protein [Pyrinomonadaceae bacterium]|nr:PqqD family protein [Pyrinomonadaceae bacterium]
MRDQIGNFSFTVSPDAAASTHDEGIVILHTGKGRLFSSNKTGALIWRGIEQRRTLDGIVAEVSGEFQIAGPTARLHTLSFLTALEQHSLISSEVVS